MIELYNNIRQEVKDAAKTAWNFAISQSNPIEVAQSLHNITEYYRLLWTEEEVEYLQFYFQLQMEMIKNG